ncbi:MAG: hypothetical protein ACPLRU_06765, partial [Desulfofundulus sp.]
ELPIRNEPSSVASCQPEIRPSSRTFFFLRFLPWVHGFRPGRYLLAYLPDPVVISGCVSGAGAMVILLFDESDLPAQGMLQGRIYDWCQG